MITELLSVLFSKPWTWTSGEKLFDEKNLCRTCLIPHQRWPYRTQKECGIDGCRTKHNPLLHTPAQEFRYNQIHLNHHLVRHTHCMDTSTWRSSEIRDKWAIINIIAFLRWRIKLNSAGIIGTAMIGLEIRCSFVEWRDYTRREGFVEVIVSGTAICNWKRANSWESETNRKHIRLWGLIR